MGEALGFASSLMGAVGSMGGGGGGGGGGAQQPQQNYIDFNATEFSNAANHILDNALMQAIPYTEKATQFGMQALQQFYQQQRKDLEKYNQIAQNQFTQQTELANARLKPISEAGYTALDQTMDILGMPRFSAGSSAVASAGAAKANRDAARRDMIAAGTQLLSTIPNMSAEDRASAMGAIKAGANPEGILLGLQEMGITGGQQRYPVNATNPSLKTVGLDLMRNPAYDQALKDANMDPSQLIGMNIPQYIEKSTAQPIPSILGDMMNGVTNMNNQIYGDFSSYLPAASAAYDQYRAAAISPQQQSILNALRSGTTGLGR